VFEFIVISLSASALIEDEAPKFIALSTLRSYHFLAEDPKSYTPLVDGNTSESMFSKSAPPPPALAKANDAVNALDANDALVTNDALVAVVAKDALVTNDALVAVVAKDALVAFCARDELTANDADVTLVTKLAIA
jgi:hypothetical protein